MPLSHGVGLLVLAFTATVQAADWYEVELLVFTSGGVGVNEELWPRFAPVQPPARAVRLDAPPADAESGEFLQLPPAALQLTGAGARLARHAGFRIILHTAWRQKLRAPGNGVPVWLQKGGDSWPQSEPATDDRSHPSEATSWPPAVVPSSPPELIGSVELFHTGHLRLAVDLVYPLQVAPERLYDAPLADPAATVPPTWAGMRIDEQRGVLPGHVYYLDHPVFGVLAQVRRYTPEATAPAVPADTNSPASLPPAY